MLNALEQEHAKAMIENFIKYQLTTCPIGLLLHQTFYMILKTFNQTCFNVRRTPRRLPSHQRVVQPPAENRTSAKASSIAACQGRPQILAAVSR